MPIFDSREFDVRLEHPDGRLVRNLFHMGDGGGCSEMAWSNDGRSLAVLTSHVANITVVDVTWALPHPAERNTHWFARSFSFSGETGSCRRTSLHFVSLSELEFRRVRLLARRDATQPRQDQLQRAGITQAPTSSCASGPRPRGLVNEAIW